MKELAILFIFLPIYHARLYVTPNTAFLASSISYKHVLQGISEANNTINNFERVLNERDDTSEDAKKLLGTIVQSGKYELDSIVDILDRIQVNTERRIKRDLTNPFYAVGDLADWAFGLVSHEQFQDFKNNVENKINYLESQQADTHEAIISNAKAVKDSVETLKKFESFLNLLIKTNDDLIRSERFILKIIRLKFELDTCLESLSNLAMMMAEALDHSDQGYASRFLFSPEYLRKYLVVLNDLHQNMSPLYSSKDVTRYYKLPLALSTINKTHLHSIIKIPLVDSDSVFDDNEENYHDGFVILSNFQYQVFLTFPQFSSCVGSPSSDDTVCFYRPCLVKNNLGEIFKCFSLNETNFLISRSDFSIQTLCSDQNTRTVDVPHTNNFAHLSIPTHCQVNSKYFVIKSLKNSPIYEKDMTSVNRIYKIEEANIIVENKFEGHKNVSIKIETREILNHINKTKQAFKSLKQDMHIPRHFEPLAITGTTVGSISIVILVFLAFIVCRHV